MTSEQFQIDGHTGGGAGIACGVNARAAGEHVGTCTANQQVGPCAAVQVVVAVCAVEHIVAAPTGQHVIASVARQHVALLRSGQVFNAGEHVARRVAAAEHASEEVDVDGAAGAVFGPVGRACAAVDVVSAAAAGDAVIACAAVDAVVCAVAHQHVVEAAADEVFEIGDQVAIGIAAAGNKAGQVDVDAVK